MGEGPEGRCGDDQRESGKHLRKADVRKAFTSRLSLVRPTAAARSLQEKDRPYDWLSDLALSTLRYSFAICSHKRETAIHCSFRPWSSHSSALVRASAACRLAASILSRILTPFAKVQREGSRNTLSTLPRAWRPPRRHAGFAYPDYVKGGFL